MPIRDRVCPTCGWVKADNYEPRTSMTVLCPEGHETEIVYVASSVAIHGDDGFIGGKTFTNMGHEPVTVHSRAEYKRELAARGLQEAVRHVDRTDGQKSHTSRWV